MGFKSRERKRIKRLRRELKAQKKEGSISRREFNVRIRQTGASFEQSGRLQRPEVRAQVAGKDVDQQRAEFEAQQQPQEIPAPLVPMAKQEKKEVILSKDSPMELRQALPVASAFQKATGAEKLRVSFEKKPLPQKRITGEIRAAPKVKGISKIEKKGEELLLQASRERIEGEVISPYFKEAGGQVLVKGAQFVRGGERFVKDPVKVGGAAFLAAATFTPAAPFIAGGLAVGAGIGGFQTLKKAGEAPNPLQKSQVVTEAAGEVAAGVGIFKAVRAAPAIKTKIFGPSTPNLKGQQYINPKTQKSVIVGEGTYKGKPAKFVIAKTSKGTVFKITQPQKVIKVIETPKDVRLVEGTINKIVYNKIVKGGQGLNLKSETFREHSIKELFRGQGLERTLLFGKEKFTRITTGTGKKGSTIIKYKGNIVQDVRSRIVTDPKLIKREPVKLELDLKGNLKKVIPIGPAQSQIQTTTGAFGPPQPQITTKIIQTPQGFERITTVQKFAKAGPRLTFGGGEVTIKGPEPLINRLKFVGLGKSGTLQIGQTKVRPAAPIQITPARPYIKGGGDLPLDLFSFNTPTPSFKAFPFLSFSTFTSSNQPVAGRVLSNSKIRSRFGSIIDTSRKTSLIPRQVINPRINTRVDITPEITQTPRQTFIPKLDSSIKPQLTARGLTTSFMTNITPGLNTQVVRTTYDTPPPPIPPPDIPPFSFGRAKRKKGKARKTKPLIQLKRFTPSATATLFNIRAPKSNLKLLSKQTFTGLELRPLVG